VAADTNGRRGAVAKIAEAVFHCLIGTEVKA